jgi:hypothetical protein
MGSWVSSLVALGRVETCSTGPVRSRPCLGEAGRPGSAANEQILKMIRSAAVTLDIERTLRHQARSREKVIKTAISVRYADW